MDDLTDFLEDVEYAETPRPANGKKTPVVRTVAISRMLVTQQEAAWLLSISEKTLIGLVDRKKVKVKKVGRYRRFRIADLQKFAASK